MAPFAVSVPVRGMDCIPGLSVGIHKPVGESFSPREGYGLHRRHPAHRRRQTGCFSPREGYGLHRLSPWLYGCCNGFSPREGYGLHHSEAEATRNLMQRFSPREGYGLHLCRRRRLLCRGRFSPREGYGLHLHRSDGGTAGRVVSVPVRGMDCIGKFAQIEALCCSTWYNPFLIL